MKKIVGAATLFFRHMIVRMAQKHEEGHKLWDDEKWVKEQWEEGFDFLLAKARASDYSTKTLVDIANYCMIKWWDNETVKK